MTIYNAKGQKVKTLVNETQVAGRHSIVWDGKDGNGSSVASGIFLYRLTTPTNIMTHKMMMMK